MITNATKEQLIKLHNLIQFEIDTLPEPKQTEIYQEDSVPSEARIAFLKKSYIELTELVGMINNL